MKKCHDLRGDFLTHTVECRLLNVTNAQTHTDVQYM